MQTHTAPADDTMTRARPNLAADHAAFTELLGAHRKIVLKVAHSYAFDPEDRADLCQEIAAQVWRAYPRYDRGQRFSTWLYRIALNVAISALRSEQPRRDQTVALDLGVHDVAVPNDHDTQAQLAELQRVIRALDPLSRAMMLLYLDGLSNREIGEVLGLSDSNVTTKISRLKQRIRDDLSPAT